MNRVVIHLLALAVLLFGGQITALARKGDPECHHIRQLLLKLENVKDDRKTLAKLFRTGDKCIDFLIHALDDSNPQVSLRSQNVIRYLGNSRGMKALAEYYATQSRITLVGPVPLPLNNWDYGVIRTNYVAKPVTWDPLSERYIYALTLDYSETARELLGLINQNAQNLEAGSTVRRALTISLRSGPKASFIVKHSLAESVLKNAFFIDVEDRKVTSSRLLALNAAGDKGLVELYINRGPLAEEWYHVVVSKQDEHWKFFSITQVAVS